MILQREVNEDSIQLKLENLKILQIFYIPDSVPENLKCFKRDGLITYTDKLKHDKFIKDIDGHFKRIEVINFDIIHRQARGETIDQNLVKKCKTIDNSSVNFCPEKGKDLALSSAFSCQRKYLFF